MANPEHLAILKKGVEAWNKWREDFRTSKPDLRNAILSDSSLGDTNFSDTDLGRVDFLRSDLRNANLRHANARNTDFRSSNLGSIDFRGADLRSADFSKADLRSANLRGAILQRANFSSTNLRNAILCNAHLHGVNLQKANLGGADLRDTVLNNTTVTDADFRETWFGGSVLGAMDLSQVKGLEEVEHLGPSTVGVDTIYMSKGQIPESFLRGCGVPEIFLAYAKSLIGSAIEFYSCFLSYSTKDQDFADRLHADLQAKGVRCWFAPHDIRGGRKLHEQIDEAIRLHDKLLLILSPHSMESEWVKTEVAKARKREVRDRARVLFPISLAPFDAIQDWEAFDADTGKDSAREIREYFIPDFSRWKDHDSYQQAFDRLLRDLHATTPLTKL